MVGRAIGTLVGMGVFFVFWYNYIVSRRGVERSQAKLQSLVLAVVWAVLYNLLRFLW